MRRRPRVRVSVSELRIGDNGDAARNVRARIDRAQRATTLVAIHECVGREALWRRRTAGALPHAVVKKRHFAKKQRAQPAKRKHKQRAPLKRRGAEARRRAFAVLFIQVMC